MKVLNYNKLVSLKPTILASFTNRIGQKFEIAEHPLSGDQSPVIIVFHDEKIAVLSDFYEPDDLISEYGGDYHPVYILGEIHLGYEVESEYPV